MKKAGFASFLILSAAVFFSCNGEKSVSLVMAESNPKGSISAQVDEIFIEKVRELSNGTIKIELYADSTLGDNTTVTNEMAKPNAKIHLARLSPAPFVTLGCKKSALPDVPYTFKDREHFWRFASSATAQEILNEPYEKGVGVKGLFFAEEGFRHFFSTKKLESIADFKGKKIRTAGNALMEEIAKCLGGEPVLVSFANIYSAMQTGEAEIAEQPIANYLANNFHKVAPYMILDAHQIGITEVAINSKTWDFLSENQKNALIEAGKAASEFCKKISAQAEEEAKNALLKDGCEFIEVKNITEWQKACADLINSLTYSDIELYGEIITLAN